jgi:outer membrane protein assembly factor BamE
MAAKVLHKFALKNGKIMSRKFLILLILLLGTITFVGCTYVKPYKVSIQQGNILDADKLAGLRVGMDKSEVESLLGAPILSNDLNHDRWDYVYNDQVNGETVASRRIELVFSNNKLVTINNK